MIVLKLLIFLSLLFPAYSKTKSKVHNRVPSKITTKRKTASEDKRQEYLLFLKGTCEVSQKDKLLRERAKVCSCFAKKMSELTEKELQHLTLDAFNKGKLSQLSEEDGAFIENYKLEVAYDCLGVEPPPGTETKDPNP